MSDAQEDDRSAPSRVLLVLLAIAVAVAVAMGVLWTRDKSASPEEVSSNLREMVPPVTERATTLTQLLMNYDEGTLQERSDQLLALSTGDFRDQYESLLKGGLDKALSSASTTAKARIVDGPDVSFTSSREAVAVLRVVQTAKNKEAPLARRIFYVLRFTLQNTSTDENVPDWRAARLDVLSQQST
jgi:hypothetical protein